MQSNDFEEFNHGFTTTWTYDGSLYNHVVNHVSSLVESSDNQSRKLIRSAKHAEERLDSLRKQIAPRLRGSWIMREDEIRILFHMGYLKRWHEAKLVAAVVALMHWVKS